MHIGKLLLYESIGQLMKHIVLRSIHLKHLFFDYIVKRIQYVLLMNEIKDGLIMYYRMDLLRRSLIRLKHLVMDFAH
jgi:hypothetical protein